VFSFALLPNLGGSRGAFQGDIRPVPNFDFLKECTFCNLALRLPMRVPRRIHQPSTIVNAEGARKILTMRRGSRSHKFEDRSEWSALCRSHQCARSKCWATDRKSGTDRDPSLAAPGSPARPSLCAAGSEQPIHPRFSGLVNLLAYLVKAITRSWYCGQEPPSPIITNFGSSFVQTHLQQSEHSVWKVSFLRP
jgi:hypothetical protein